MFRHAPSRRSSRSKSARRNPSLRNRLPDNSRFRHLLHEQLEDRRMLTSVSGISPADGSTTTPPSLDTTSAGVASLTAMDGGNGGWAVWYGAGGVTQQIRVSVTGDSNAESDERFYVLLSNPSGNPIIQDGQGIAEVVDDDTAFLSVSDASLDEGDEGINLITFVVSRSGNTSGVSTVNFATSDGTALVADNDFVPNSGSVTFLSGASSAAIQVEVVGDTSFEEDEAFHIDLSEPSENAVILDVRAVGIIVNDDASPSESYTSQDGPIAIPDAHAKRGTKTVQSQIRVVGSAIHAIGTLSVELNFSHGNPWQLVASLESPSGNVVDLRTGEDPPTGIVLQECRF